MRSFHETPLTCLCIQVCNNNTIIKTMKINQLLKVTFQGVRNATGTLMITFDKSKRVGSPIWNSARSTHLNIRRSIRNENDLSVEAQSVVDKIKDGNRGSLAAAITLMETEHKLKKKLAKKILDLILSDTTTNRSQSLRIGISGPPGAGKSTLIETFGKYLTANGHKVAVLAVDPSSASTGGSLLGDKTRMPNLTKDPNAYIRPSPARGHLGGVTRSTNESILVCEYGGYDVIIVETVGVGQSEYAVTNMTDVFVLLLPPGGGDELQGIKKGIVERADIIVITKADGDLQAAAHRAQYEYTASLKYMRPVNPNWKPKVQQVSAKTQNGIDKFWDTIQNYRKVTASQFLSKRANQRVVWAWMHIQDGLREVILEDPKMRATTEMLIEQVRLGELTPGTAADRIIDIVMSFMKE